MKLSQGIAAVLKFSEICCSFEVFWNLLQFWNLNSSHMKLSQGIAAVLKFSDICCSFEIKTAAIWNYDEALLQFWLLTVGSHTVDFNNECPQIGWNVGHRKKWSSRVIVKCYDQLWWYYHICSSRDMATCDVIITHVIILILRFAVDQHGTKSSSLRISRCLKIVPVDKSNHLHKRISWGGGCRRNFGKDSFGVLWSCTVRRLFLWLGVSLCWL